MKAAAGHSDQTIDLLTVKEVAKLLKVSTRTIQRYRETNAFPDAIVFPKGAIRFRANEIQEWCDTLRASANKKRKRIPKVPIADARSLAFSQFDGPIATTH